MGVNSGAIELRAAHSRWERIVKGRVSLHGRERTISVTVDQRKDALTQGLRASGVTGLHPGRSAAALREE